MFPVNDKQNLPPKLTRPSRLVPHGCPAGIRTPTNRTRICRATVTPPGKNVGPYKLKIIDRCKSNLTCRGTGPCYNKKPSRLNGRAFLEILI